VSDHFNPIKKHYGIDLVAPKNTPVKAILDGYVFSSDWTLETGNTVGIVHDNNIISFYKHNAVNLKKAGTYVRAGEAIAIIGNTGILTDGPHLHFELWVDGTPVNPADYFSFK
jgi:murein DD-endopeptidase MepM/ murein hydrolase activator NlpD